MKVVIDIEANSLLNPTKIWLIVCKDIETGRLYVFRHVTEQEEERTKFLEFAKGVDLWIGHNILGYDLPHLSTLIKLDIDPVSCIDTLIISKLYDYSRDGHSIEDYGIEFGLEKGKHLDFTKWSQELEDYCIRDVDIAHKIYLKYLKYIETYREAIDLEHKFQLIVNTLTTNGFSFNKTKASSLLSKVEEELSVLDKEILKAFPPKEVLIREFTPKATKFGTISKTSVPRSLHENISEYEIGKTYRHTELVPFNPASHKQIIEVLNEAGWSPTDKTATHIDTERALGKLKYSREEKSQVDLAAERVILEGKLELLRKTGWKINEQNLGTLPDTAPPPARLLAKRILLEARRRTLTEWLSLVSDDNRIHGKFYGIGAWTHRMAHQNPNTANIPSEFQMDGSPKLLGREMRSLWQAPRNRLLVGVDAVAIQLCIFAHLIDDAEFTFSLVEGKKSDKTDAHSLNQRILGDVCRTRQAAKRFIYALLLGAGLGKLAEILGCDEASARAALDRLLERYTGFATLKSDVIPKDARRGYFIGLDGRRVPIPGEELGLRRHLCMSGYLQNGEAVVMKKACVLWHDMLKEEKLWKFVNFVHDEWQTEVANNMEVALRIAKVQADSLRIVGEQLNLKCPLAGSYWNEDHGDYTIGTNWYQTH